MTIAKILALLAAAFTGSVIGSMAGGGTLITFSTLVFLGVPAIVANATATVGMVPTGAAAMLGHWADVRENRRWLRALLLPGLAGGAIGSVLLIATPERSFERLAPFLVFFATGLFVLQGLIPDNWMRGMNPRRARAKIFVGGVLLFAVAIYEGYFGAGSGILILAILGFLGLSDIHARNGLKGFFVVAINAVASAYFLYRGAVDLNAAGVMIVGSFAGGYSGARFARRIGREKARLAVVVIGVILGVLLLARGNKL
jgi:uncharacterized membrane protein YfcA